MSHTIKHAYPKEQSGYISAEKMERGQLMLTTGGHYVIRTDDGLVYLGDGSGGKGYEQYAKGKILPVGTEITITVSK